MQRGSRHHLVAFSLAALAVVAFVGFAASHTKNEAGELDMPSFDDGFENTSSSYPCPEFAQDCVTDHIAFLNSTSIVTNQSFSYFYEYNVTGPNWAFINGTVVGLSDSPPITLNISNATIEGRYEIWNESHANRSGNYVHKHLDLVVPTSNVTGRIKLPFGASTVTVNLYWWGNQSKMDTSGNRVNISTPSVWPSGGTPSDEFLYRINLTNRDKYFIGVNGPNIGFKAVPTRAVMQESEQGVLPAVSSPRINDIFGFSGPTTLNASVQFRNGTPVTGLQFRLRTKCAFGQRCPHPNIPAFFSYRPPRIENMTVPGGGGVTDLYFTDVMRPGAVRYEIDVVNESFSRTGKDGFAGADFQQVGSGPDAAFQFEGGPINVTPHVGHVNGTIAGADSAGYMLIAFPGSTSFEDEGSAVFTHVVENHNSVWMQSLPNGTYSLVAAKFASAGRPRTTTTTVDVRKGKNATIDVEFPTYVNLTVNVSTKSGKNPIKDARVTVENESEFRYFSGKTKADGVALLQVVNNTQYSVRVSPPFNSDLSGNTTTVFVNESGTQQNVTLSAGATLTGYVTDASGNAVTDAFVEVQNFSQGVFAFDNVNSNGKYNVSGLTRGINYSVAVESPTGESTSKFLYKTGADTRMYNITVSVARGLVSGNVSDGTHPVSATVTLLNRENGTRMTMQTNASGGFAFGDQPRRAYYRLRVVPDDASFAPATRSFGLSGNVSIDVVVSTQTGISGYVTFEGNDTGVSGAGVYASNASRNSFGYTRSGPDGFYSLDVENVTHQVDVFKQGYPLNETNVSAEPGGTTQNLTVPIGENLSGYITRNGKILKVSGSIGVYNVSAGSFGFTDLSSGAYSFNGLKNVSHNVWISVDRDGIDPVTTTLDWTSVTGPAGYNFSVAGNKGQKLNVTVVDGNGNPVANATVRTAVRTKTTDANGTVSFPNQSIGTVTVAANKDGYEGSIRSVDISKPCAGSGCQVQVPRYKVLNGSSFTPNPITITNIQELEVSVNLTKNGKDVSAATVAFFANSTSVSLSGSAVTGSTGEATVSGLGKGGFLVTVAKNGKGYTNSTILSSGDTRTLQVGPYDLFYEVRKP